MFRNLRNFISTKELKSALFLAVLSSMILALIAMIDLKFDFASGGFAETSDTMKFAFFALAIYIFIKIFTFFKRFYFWALMLFVVIFMVDFYIVLNLLTGFDGTYKELSEIAIYKALIALNFLYILILNIIPDGIFNSQKDS
ncbi:hypothetical protein ACHJH3_00800 [Campylobacter sp. MOP7]|uniref:hypothetical protein n=1 Tax=Campylobacter canis TaxID=3378588 RepID=UPI00387E21C8